MKIAYIGGGSMGLPALVRDLLLWDELPAKVELALYDRSIERADAVKSLIKQCPEMQNVSGVHVETVADLDTAIEGADFVLVIVCPWSGGAFHTSERICFDHDFIGSDNVSAQGMFLAARGGPLVLDIARRMEKTAPTGTMIIFTNPIATLAAIVSRATTIRAIGICGGQANHCYDISRMMGWDKIRFDFEVEVAGTNHMSWIKSLKLDGENFFPTLDARLAQPLDFDAMHPQSMRGHFEFMFPKIVEAYRKFDAFLFSTEGDGLPHLMYYKSEVETCKARSSEAPDPNAAARRGQEIARFINMSKEPLTPEQWDDPSLKVEDPKVATANLVIKGLAGTKPIETTISYSNNGAIIGFEDDMVTEYTAILQNGTITPKGRQTMPPGTLGVTVSIIESQMLTADAVINEDCRTFIQSVYAYPPCRDSGVVDSFYKQMVAGNREELPSWIV